MENNILDKQEAYSEPAPGPKQRPVAITVVCILGFIGAGVAVLALPFLYSQLSRMIGGWYPPFLILSAAIGLISLIGMWKMKRMGVFLYTGMAAFNQVLMLVMGVWSPLGLIMPAIVVAIGFTHISKMD